MPANWQTFHDKQGVYTLRLPPGWTAQLEPDAATYGDSAGEEMVIFDDPLQGTASAQIVIIVYPIPTASDRQSICKGPPFARVSQP